MSYRDNVIAQRCQLCGVFSAGMLCGLCGELDKELDLAEAQHHAQRSAEMFAGLPRIDQGIASQPRRLRALAAWLIVLITIAAWRLIATHPKHLWR